MSSCFIRINIVVFMVFATNDHISFEVVFAIMSFLHFVDSRSWSKLTHIDFIALLSRFYFFLAVAFQYSQEEYDITTNIRRRKIPVREVFFRLFKIRANRFLGYVLFISSCQCSIVVVVAVENTVLSLSTSLDFRKIVMCSCHASKFECSVKCRSIKCSTNVHTMHLSV